MCSYECAFSTIAATSGKFVMFKTGCPSASWYEPFTPPQSY